MKTYGEWTSKLDGGEWSASSFGHFTPSRCPMYRRLGRSENQYRSFGEEKISSHYLESNVEPSFLYPIA
jgi:hypothetical protein